MISLLALPISLGSCLAAWWLTGRVRRYSLDRRILDIPNPRSSHSVATPRGGGMAIVVTTLAALVIAGSLGLLSWLRITGMLGGGGLVAALGFIDDHRDLPRRWRLVGHFVAAGWLLVCFGGLPPLHVMGVVIDLGWAGHALAAMYLVWLLNLTNFMDGIDGIAAVEAITVCLGGVLLYLVAAPGANEWIAPLLLASSTLGFLLWNWPPAKIFMGDGGSGFIGLMMGALSLQAAWTSPALLWGWVILPGVFIVDATITLLRRAVRGERFYEAHRMHAYQHAARRWTAHKPVTLVVAAINVLWLLPLAALVARGMLDGLVAVLVAYAPLVVIAMGLGAGAPQPAPVQLGARHV